jgi:uncharacterized membrane protein YhdT
MADLIKKYDIKVDPRYRQCNKEALITFLVYVAFGIFNSIVIYVLGVRKSPSEYGFVWGLPSWLFYGVIVVGALFFVAVLITVKFVYKELPLESERKEV